MITFPAFIHEPNGIILVSDGERQATFANVALFNEAIPGYALPLGCIGVSYERRTGNLMHRRTVAGGGVQFLDGQVVPEFDDIIDQMDGIMAATIAQDHPMHGYSELGQAKARAAMLVDTDAERERLLLITPGAGQAMVYQEKKAEAVALLGEISGGAVLGDIDASKYPFLSAEVGLTGNDLEAVAQAVAAQSALWTQGTAAIEAVRLSVKSDISGAANVAEVRGIFDALEWPSIT